MTPAGLLRLGLSRGSRWRVLALFAGLAVLPSLVAALPIWRFLSAHLDRSVAADTVAGDLTLPVALELLRALADQQGGPAIGLGLASGLVIALVVGPWSAGAALAEGRAAEPMQIRGLLAAAGDLYGRLARMVVVAVLPLGLAWLAAGGLFAGARAASAKAFTESAGRAPYLWAGLIAAGLLFVAHLTLDAGRAQIAARPVRRSAFLAWVAGASLVLRRPIRSGLLGLAGTGLGLGGAFVLMALRGLLPAGPGWATALGFVLAALATAAVAWGRSVRLAALSELAALDAAERVRRRVLRAARRASRSAATEPILPAAGEGTTSHTLDITAPISSPPPPGEPP